MLKKHFSKKVKLVEESLKDVFNWDSFLAISIPLYLIVYGYLFKLLGLWENLSVAIINNDVLTKEWFYVFIGYLFLVYWSRILTEVGINLWRRDK